MSTVNENTLKMRLSTCDLFEDPAPDKVVEPTDEAFARPEVGRADEIVVTAVENAVASAATDQRAPSVTTTEPKPVSVTPPANETIPLGIPLADLLKPEAVPDESAPVEETMAFVLALLSWNRYKSRELKRIRHQMGMSMLARAVEIAKEGGLKCWITKHFPTGQLPYESARHWYEFAMRAEPADLASDESYTEVLTRLGILGPYRQKERAKAKKGNRGNDGGGLAGGDSGGGDNDGSVGDGGNQVDDGGDGGGRGNHANGGGDEDVPSVDSRCGSWFATSAKHSFRAIDAHDSRVRVRIRSSPSDEISILPGW